MGGSGSSSRRKSSKRKRKRDRKKRSPRKESRKRQRRCDSSSSYSSGDSLYSGHNKNLSTSSDDQSMSSDSDSKSAYDRRHKRRRARQSRLSLKSTKKGRDRKKPAISSSDSDAGDVRKSTWSRRGVKTRKKSSKKRSRKHLSSSPSYDSESCSTCPSRSSSDGKHLKSEAVINKESSRGRESHKAHKRRRIRSPSYSSHSSRSNQSVGVSHGGGTVNNHRRLRSVIAIADQSCNEETNRWEMDPQKEVIVYDEEDYPSPRSLDSNENANKLESGNDYHDPLSNRTRVEDITGEKASETVYVGDRQPERSHMNNVVVKDHDVSVPAAALDDLESTLRRKALENLRKFRGELPSISLKTENSGSDVNAMATQEADNLAEQGSSDVQVTSQCMSSSKRDSAHLNLIEVQKTPEDEHNEQGYEMIEQNAVNPHDGPAHLGCSKEDIGTSSQTVLLPTSDTNSGAVATNPMASVGIFTGNNRLDRENETTDGSQFEQRTMSVMRGGEAVQVSYKVYIPKRTPALARRQLKRKRGSALACDLRCTSVMMTKYRRQGNHQCQDRILSWSH